MALASTRLSVESASFWTLMKANSMAKPFEEAGELSSTDALRIIAKTLAIVAMRMEPSANTTLENKAAFLVSCGFDTKTIATMLESSVTTIAPLLSRRKGKVKAGSRRKALR